MPIRNHLMAKNSNVIFGARTDSTFVVSHYEKHTCLSPLSIQFFFHPLVLLTEFETVGLLIRVSLLALQWAVYRSSCNKRDSRHAASDVGSKQLGF